ncbi:MAG: hypothetical protein ACOCUI_04355 [bacterium]
MLNIVNKIINFIKEEIKIKIIGLDLGYGQVKCTDGLKNVKFQSVIGNMGSSDYQIDTSNKKNSCFVNYEGEDYIVGNLANTVSINPRQNTLSKKSANIKDEIIKALTAIVLTEPDKMVHNVNIVTGLPVLYFNEQYNELKQNLLGSHLLTIVLDDYPSFKTINIENIEVIPQGIGALYNEILDNDALVKNSELANQYIGIIDIGYKTTDLVVMDSLVNAGHLGDTINTGMKEAFIELKKLISKNFKVNKKLIDMPEIAINNVIKLSGKEKSIGNLVHNSYKPVAQTIFSHIQDMWGDLRELDAILLTGGGAKALDYEFRQILNKQDLLNDINYIICEKAEFGNAYGDYKYGKLKF